VGAACGSPPLWRHCQLGRPMTELEQLKQDSEALSTNDDEVDPTFRHPKELHRQDAQPCCCLGPRGQVCLALVSVAIVAFCGGAAMSHVQLQVSESQQMQDWQKSWRQTEPQPLRDFEKSSSGWMKSLPKVALPVLSASKPAATASQEQHGPGQDRLATKFDCQLHCKATPWALGVSSLRAKVTKLEDDNAKLKDEVRAWQQQQQRDQPLRTQPSWWETLVGHVPQSQPAPLVTPRRYAWVTLAYDLPGRCDHLWEVLPVARVLQRMSQYPLIVLTNTTQFPHGESVDEVLQRLHAKRLPLYAVNRSNGKRFAFRSWNIAFWKLQIWKLTEYEKLIWLDSDSILYRSMDWLFQRDWMWAQRDDWFCHGQQPHVCSGIMLLYPNASDFEGFLELDAQQHGGWKHGDQQLISHYFKEVRKRPINLLHDLEASFGQCLGKATSFYKNKDNSSVTGAWSTPNFVHKSGGWGNTDSNIYNNVCFSHNLTRMYYTVGGTLVNICHYHPLGSYWRSAFCEAMAISKLQAVTEVGTFCSDECWYHGGNKEGCRGVNSAVPTMTGLPGMPFVEIMPSLTGTGSLKTEMRENPGEYSVSMGDAGWGGPAQPVPGLATPRQGTPEPSRHQTWR